jgi:hypothetical protein
MGSPDEGQPFVAISRVRLINAARRRQEHPLIRQTYVDVAIKFDGLCRAAFQPASAVGARAATIPGGKLPPEDRYLTARFRSSQPTKLSTDLAPRLNWDQQDPKTSAAQCPLRSESFAKLFWHPKLATLFQIKS